MTPFFQLVVLHADSVVRALHEPDESSASPRHAVDSADHSPIPHHDNRRTDARLAPADRIPGERRDQPDERPRTPTQAMAELRGLGLKVAVVGVSDDHRTRLEQLGWTPQGSADTRVDALVDMHELPAGPPAPHQIHAAMARTGVADVHRVIAVGSRIAEMRAGRNSGGVVIGLLSGDADTSELLEAGADEVLDSLTDLPHWVSRARVRPPLPAA